MAMLLRRMGDINIPQECNDQSKWTYSRASDGRCYGHCGGKDLPALSSQCGPVPQSQVAPSSTTGTTVQGSITNITAQGNALTTGAAAVQSSGGASAGQYGFDFTTIPTYAWLIGGGLLLFLLMQKGSAQ